MCQIETAEAEIARQLYDEGTSPGLRPLTADDSVFTYFWADNFNKKVDSEKGTNMIDSTHLIKFQEESPRSVYQTMSKTVPRTKLKYHVSDFLIKISFTSIPKNRNRSFNFKEETEAAMKCLMCSTFYGEYSVT